VRAGLTIVFAVDSAAFASWVSRLPQVQQMVPAGVINVVNGFGVEAGKPLASSPRVKKVACTGGYHHRASDHAVRLAEHHSGHARAGRQEPEHLLLRRAGRERRLRRQVAGGFTMFALNQGEVCTCPSRALVERPIYDEFLEAATIRTKAVRQGDPLESETMIGAQASTDQLEKILSYIDIGKAEGARVVLGGERVELGGHLSGGYYVQPTIFAGDNRMRVFEEEIFGPVVSVTQFDGEDDAVTIANDTLYGLGAGVWTRDINRAYRMGRAIQAGRVWTNCFHVYPAHAAFGGYKQSGIGRENHLMMLEHYQQTKNLLVSYSPKAQGFF